LTDISVTGKTSETVAMSEFCPLFRSRLSGMFPKQVRKPSRQINLCSLCMFYVCLYCSVCSAALCSTGASKGTPATQNASQKPHGGGKKRKL